MGLYSFFLAGSNYVAPVICGFIAEYHGWRWVFYWPSIFVAVALVFLFFFMEETTYNRYTENTTTTPVASSSSSDPEKGGPADMASSQESPEPIYKKKTYIQKLALLGPRQAKNNMIRRARQILYFLSWPVIFYAGYVSPNGFGHSY